MSRRYTHWVTEKAKADAHVERLTEELLRKAALLAKWRETRDRAQGHLERLEQEAAEAEAQGAVAEILGQEVKIRIGEALDREGNALLNAMRDRIYEVAP